MSSDHRLGLAERGDCTLLWLTGLAKVIPQMVCAQPIHITATHIPGCEDQSTLTLVAESKRHPSHAAPQFSTQS